MSIFYPESDLHVEWTGIEPLDYHYLAIRDTSIDKYIYYNYDGKPGRIDMYGISIPVPFDAENIQVYLKCKARAGSSIPASENPNNTHLIVTLGYTDKIIDEVYISKNYANLTPEWQEFRTLVSLNQPHHFHHYHTLPFPYPESPHEYHPLIPPESDMDECSKTPKLSHAAPPATLTPEMRLNEINYISVTGILVDPSSWLYVASLGLEVTYD